MTEVPQSKELTIHIPSCEFERIGLDTLVDIRCEAERGRTRLLTCDGDRLRGIVHLERPIEQTDVPVGEIDHLQLIDAGQSGYEYLFLLTVPGAEFGHDHCRHLMLCEGNLADADSGVNFCVVADHDGLEAFHDSLSGSDLTYSVVQVGDYGGGPRPTGGLTERQWEVLLCAYEMGYYDIPRDATLADIANRLQIDRSTVCEHIRRAERHVLSNILQ